MNEAAALTFAAAVPFLLLGLLLWLARLEDTLGDGLDVPRATRDDVASPAGTAVPAQAAATQAPAPAAAPAAA